MRILIRVAMIAALVFPASAAFTFPVRAAECPALVLDRAKPRSEQERLVERLKRLREQFQEETPSGMEPTRPLFCERLLDGKWVKAECPTRNR